MMTSRVAWSDITSNSFTETGYLAPPGGPFQKVMTIHATRVAEGSMKDITNFFHHTSRAGVVVLIAMIPVCVAVPQAKGSASEIQTPAQAAWPKTQLRQGRYFSFAAPAGWQVSESTNGVDLAHPDGSEAISFVGLEGSPGSSSPVQQIQMIGQVLGLRRLEFTETRH